MVKVENRELMVLLTKRIMRMNRGRNLIAQLSIILTTLLFTSVFTASVSMVLSNRETQIRQSMNCAHAVASELTEKEEENLLAAVKEDTFVARAGRGRYVGLISDSRLGFRGEVRYGDENMEECFLSKPLTGNLPKAPNEIAASSLLLDSLGIPRQIGAQVSLTIEINSETGQTRTDTFLLSGYWEGDKALPSQLAWVSEAYAKEAVTTDSEIEGPSNGALSVCVWYKSLGCLKEKTKRLSERAGLAQGEGKLLANLSYNLFEEDAFSFGTLIILTAMILLSGYLIISNIFDISINTDIRVYGLLKNVGTTGKQLKQIVRRQAWSLSVRAIPLGLMTGYLLGCKIMPAVMAGIIKKEGQVIRTSANPLIFVLAAAFSFLTVYTASLKACRKVERVSPVEALRMEEGRESKRGTKGNTGVSWWGMAAANVGRNFPKGLVVMISIALSLVAMNCVVLLVRRYRMEEFTDVYQDADFRISQVGSTLQASNFQGINQEMRRILNACPYSAGTGYSYYSRETHILEGSLRKALREMREAYQEYFSEYEQELWNQTFERGEIVVHFMGINQAAFERLEWRGKPCTWEEFRTGDYALTDYPRRYAMQADFSYYHKGDIFSMNYQNGKEKDYQILGTASLPYSLDYPFADLVFLTILVPEEEYLACTGNPSAMYAALYAIDGVEEQADSYIKDTLLSEYQMLHVSSILDMQEGFREYLDKFYIIGGMLAAVLALIGIMNFFNLSATSILTRRQELTLLESVGMTKVQIRRMLAAEGCIYLFGALFLAMVFLLLFAERLLSATVGKAFFFHMQMTLTPCILMIPFLLLIAWGVPMYQFKKMERESIVERMQPLFWY